MPLTDRQVAAVTILSWLLDQGDPPRQTGRTMVFAVVLIRQALQHPGRVIFFRDHYAPRAADLMVIRSMVLHLMGSDPSLMGSAHIDVREDRFSIQLLDERRPLPNWREWVPPESLLEPSRVNLRSGLMESLVWEQRLDDLLRQVEYAERGDSVLPRTRYERLLDDD